MTNQLRRMAPEPPEQRAREARIFADGFYAKLMEEGRLKKPEEVVQGVMSLPRQPALSITDWKNDQRVYMFKRLKRLVKSLSADDLSYMHQNASRALSESYIENSLRRFEALDLNAKT